MDRPAAAVSAARTRDTRMHTAPTPQHPKGGKGGPKQTAAGPARTDGRPERKARAARAKHQAVSVARCSECMTQVPATFSTGMQIHALSGDVQDLCVCVRMPSQSIIICRHDADSVLTTMTA